MFVMILMVHFAVGLISFYLNYLIMRLNNEQIVVKEIIGSLPIVLFGYVSPIILLYKIYMVYGNKKLKK